MILILSKHDDNWRNLTPQIISAFNSEECIVTDNYEEAIRIITGKTSPIIILDYDFSEPNPFFILRILRTKAENVKFILVVDSLGQREMAEAGGADDVLFHGFSADELIHTIKKLSPYHKED